MNQNAQLRALFESRSPSATSYAFLDDALCNHDHTTVLDIMTCYVLKLKPAANMSRREQRRSMFIDHAETEAPIEMLFMLKPRIIIIILGAPWDDNTDHERIYESRYKSSRRRML